MKNMRVLLTIILLLFIFPVMHNSALADDVMVSTYEELASAVHSARDEMHIILNDSFIFERKGDEAQIIIPAGSQVVIETTGKGIVLSHGTGGNMFYVEDGAKLSLNGGQDAGLTLRETVLTEEWSNSCVAVAGGGSFEANFVSFEGFFAEKGAAVCLNDQETTVQTQGSVLKNCQFSGNHAVQGGSVYVGTGRKAEIYASSFTSNTAAEKGNDAFVSGTLIFGDNNILSSFGPLNYETEADGSFLYAGQIYGTGTFELSERTSVSGVVSWSMDSTVPESVQVILLANGTETARKTVTEAEDGYWVFTFNDLPLKDAGTPVQYDIGEYSVPGFRFSKRGEADVGFELLYVANTQDAFSEMPAGSDGQQGFEIQNDTLISVSEDNPNAVSVTKSPTNEKVEIGGQAIFIARAENNTGIIWHLISPDGQEDYRDEEMSSAFTSLELEGIGSERLKLKVIPLSLNGWKIRAEFSGIGGPVFSQDALITVEGAAANMDEVHSETKQNSEQEAFEAAVHEMPEEIHVPESSESKPAAETVPAGKSEAMMVEITKNPTNEHADLGGNAIFIARAEHAQQIIWHVLSPDDTVNYEGEQILNAFDGIKIEGLGTERIKIINIPVAMNGWKVQAEFIGEANRVLSDKAAILINDYEGIYQNEPNDSNTEQLSAPEESILSAVQSAEISPSVVEMSDSTIGMAAETYVSQSNTETVQRMINVASLWNDNSDAAGKRPAMTIVELYRDGALYFTAVLNSSNGWMYTFNNLPEGNYKIKENSIPDYTISYSVSGETVTIVHTISGESGQQLPALSDTPAPVSTTFPNLGAGSLSVSSPEPTMQATETAKPTMVPTPAVVSEQTVYEQDMESEETDLGERGNSGKQGFSLMLLVGILGGAGILCAVVAIYLIRKMK